MAGLFGFFDYSKEGPGVDPNAPPKGPIKTFFQIWGRKFWKLITVNLFMVLCNLPVLIGAWFMSGFISPLLFPGKNSQNLVDTLIRQGVTGDLSRQIVAYQGMFIDIISVLFLVGMSFVVIGPVQAGMTFIVRNYAREQHAFLWMDFREQFIKNWKQALAHSIISVFCAFVFPIAFSFYWRQMTSRILGAIFSALIIMLAVIVCMMQAYVYQIMVTFDLKLKDIYRNAFLLVMAKLPVNFLVFLLSLVIVGLIPFLGFIFFPQYALVIVVLYALFFAFSLTLFLQNYNVNRQINRYMMPKVTSDENLSNEGNEDGNKH